MNMKKSKRENLKVDCNQNFLFVFSSFFFLAVGGWVFLLLSFPPEVTTVLLARMLQPLFEPLLASKNVLKLDLSP